MAVQQDLIRSEPKEEPLITGEELAAMGDLGRSELVEGRIVRLSPTKMPHGQIESDITYLLKRYLEDNDLGIVMGGEIGIYTQRDPDTIRGADVLFISHERLAKATPGGFLDVAPELIVEVMSPSDRWGDVRKKIREYFAIGVTAVLIVEPEEQMVSLYRSPTDMRDYSSEDIVQIDDILPGFGLQLNRLWSR